MPAVMPHLNLENVNAAAAPDNVLELRDVTLTFPTRRKPAIRNVSIAVPRGEFVSVIGPSGCGKSTVLNLAAGLLQPTRGSVLHDGASLTGLNPRAAYVTQNANLLPWMTTAANIGLPLRIVGVGKAERAERVQDWVERVGLSGFEKHYPHELSGGMQKRCAIARALIAHPQMLLMDEPFGPLDAITRLKLQQELLNLFEGTSVSVVFVTHDLGEAIGMSDRVVVFSQGPGQVREVMTVDLPRPRLVADIGSSKEYQHRYSELFEFFRND